MKKLAIIVRSAQTGGVENHVYEILKSAGSFGYEPILISLVDVPVADKFKDLGIEIRTLKDKMSMSPRSTSIIYPLYKLLKKIDPDLVHLHGTRPIFIGSVAARLARIQQIVVTLHGSYKLMAYNKNTGKIDYKLLFVSKVIHTIGFMLAKRIIVDAFALVSEVNGACKYFPLKMGKIRNKIRPIHIGIDMRNIKKRHDRDRIRKKIGLQDGTRVIGTIGRLDEPMKGIEILLRAVRKLFDDGCVFDVLIAGKGDSKRGLEALSNKLGINKNVHFLGYWEDLAEIYSILDIFVLPSFSEGFPIVNLEAMAFGLPVVSTNVGGVPEAVKNLVAGLIVPPRDADAIGVAMQFLLENDAVRLKMGLEGELRVKHYFADIVMMKKIFTLYDQVLDI